VERRVERPVAHLQYVARDLLQSLRDRPRVERLERNDLQQQQVERALHQVGRLAHVDFLPFTFCR
jgi:hypothetical protein